MLVTERCSPPSRSLRPTDLPGRVHGPPDGALRPRCGWRWRIESVHQLVNRSSVWQCHPFSTPPIPPRPWRVGLALGHACFCGGWLAGFNFRDTTGPNVLIRPLLLLNLLQQLPAPAGCSAAGSFARGRAWALFLGMSTTVDKLPTTSAAMISLDA
jgi:hypothetical protein